MLARTFEKSKLVSSKKVQQKDPDAIVVPIAHFDFDVENETFIAYGKKALLSSKCSESLPRDTPETEK